MRQTRFCLDYVSTQGFIRYYYPDFLIRLGSGIHYLLETKGAETVEVPLKSARAERWAHDVTTLTGVEWRYLKLPQDIFDRSTAKTFGELADQTRALQASQPELIASLPDVEERSTVTFTPMTPKVVRADLERFEQQFGISSTEFLRRFEVGEFHDPVAVTWEYACDLAHKMDIPLT